MINHIWFIIIISSILVSLFNGNIYNLNQVIFNSTLDSVQLAIKLLGPMVFWMGIMNIIKKSGFINLLNNFFEPFYKILFPKVKSNNEISSAILLNMSANFIGLGNAATPLGINAMKELQKVNKNKNIASPAMCTLLALNTSSLTVLPTTIISLRIASSSLEPESIIITTIFATSISTITAIILDKFFRSIKRRDK